MKLKNPIIVASSGIAADTDRMLRAEDAGAGAVVMKSLFEEEFCRRDPSPRFRILEHKLGGFRSSTLYSYEQASHFDEHRYALEIQRAKERLSIPVIASLDCVTDEGWVKFAALLEQAGADAIEVKACPHGVSMMEGRDTSAGMARALALLQSKAKVPLLAKLVPQLTHPASVARALEEAGASAVVMFNRFSGLDVDLESETPILHGGYAGHGGPWSIYYCLRWVSETFKLISIPISGSGGVMSGEDAAKYILAGARTVQVCTAVVVRGYGVFGEILQGLGRWMEKKGYQSITEYQGKAARAVRSTREIARGGAVKALIDKGSCTSCDRCAPVCFERAISPNPYRVEPDLCTGCGLCVEVCPTAAIRMIAPGSSQASA